MRVLRDLFPGKLISLRGDVAWPPRSPDLKAKVYTHRPHTLADLKRVIQAEVAAIPQDMTRRVMIDFRHRLEMCIARNGQHLPDVIFKT